MLLCWSHRCSTRQLSQHTQDPGSCHAYGYGHCEHTVMCILSDSRAILSLCACAQCGRRKRDVGDAPRAGRAAAATALGLLFVSSWLTLTMSASAVRPSESSAVKQFACVDACGPDGLRWQCSTLPALRAAPQARATGAHSRWSRRAAAGAERVSSQRLVEDLLSKACGQRACSRRGRRSAPFPHGRWPMMSPVAVSGHYARPAVPLARGMCR